MNVKPRTIFTGDNLSVLRGLEPESVQMVYTDPPYNSGKEWAAPIGSAAAGAMFRDSWTLNDIDVAWSGEIRAPARHIGPNRGGRVVSGRSMQAYLTMMAVRLIEIRRVLKPSGVFYLHCDLTAGAYLKVLYDSVFGASQFRADAIWKRTAVHSSARRWAPVHDTTLMYSHSDKYQWHQTYQPYDAETARLLAEVKVEFHIVQYRLVKLSLPSLRRNGLAQPFTCRPMRGASSRSTRAPRPFP